MLISFAVTAKPICVFVFANAKCWFSHDVAHIKFQQLSQEHLHVSFRNDLKEVGKATCCYFLLFIIYRQAQPNNVDPGQTRGSRSVLFAVLSTLKFLNFRMPENFAVIYLKFKQKAQNLRFFCQKCNGIANSEDPDQTAPLGAVWSGSALFAQTYMSENLGSLRYILRWHFSTACPECLNVSRNTEILLKFENFGLL